MVAHSDEFRISSMCRVLKVTRSAYYAWLANPMSSWDMANAALLTEIITCFEASYGTYGIKRIHRSLQQKGIQCGESRVAKIMKYKRIKPIRRTRKPYSGKGQRDEVTDNVLARQFTVQKPNQVWVTDMTYISTQNGFAYLTAVLDLYSRAIVGWEIDDAPKTDLMIAAVSKALLSRSPIEPVMLHSDQGTQYTSKAFRDWCRDKNITTSMSRKGNCHDNAVMESFFSSLKKEWIQGKRYHSVADLRSTLFIYIDDFYNKKRLHSSNNYRTPLDFEGRSM
jgi:putative transposase